MSWDRDWSVETWLEALGLGCYTEPFLDNGYDLQELCANLKAEDLDAIGVEDEAHRARIFSEASKLRDEARARFKKSKGGGSSGSTDHSGSLGSRGSFPAYSEPWSEDSQQQKHVYSEVWEQSPPTDGGGVGGITPALAQLMMPNGSSGGEKHRGHTFPPGPPSKVPRKKLPTSPGPVGSQVSFTLPAPRAAPSGTGGGGGGLNKLQLKLKVLEELQKDRVILSEPPYCKEDGCMDEERVSELCQTYSERFSIEPSQIMDTMRVICKAADPKTQDEPDGTNLSVKNPPLLCTSDTYEEPLDVMKDDLSTFKDPVTPTSPLKKSPPKKRDSPQLLQKPKPSSSDSSPEPKRRGGSPRSSPHVSPVTSPKEHKKFGFFSKKAKKKPVRSNSVKEGGRAGKVVLLPGKYNEEGAATTSPLSSKKRPARPSLSLTSPPSSPSSATGLKTSGKNHRTVSVSSTSTTGSETSPPAPKKFGIMRFSERSPRLQRKAKTVGRGKATLESSLSASDMALDRVGVSSEPEVAGGERLRGAQSHNDLLNAQVSVDSPATSQRRRVESRDKRGGLLGLLKRKTVGGKRGRKGKERREGEEEGEREEGGKGGRGGEGPSFLTASMSLPNIAAQLGDKVSTAPSPLATPTHRTSTEHKKSATVPPKPSRHTLLHPPIEIPPPSPETSPLPLRRVQQSTGEPPGDRLIRIKDGGGPGRGGAGEEISSWSPVSPSHLILNPPRGFESDVFAGTAPHEQVSDFGEPSSQRNSLRDSVTSYHSAASDTVGGSLARSGDVASSVGSENSLVFGSCTSGTSSVSLAKTSSFGSVKKPPPPPKPKSLERNKTRGGRVSEPRVVSPDPRPTSPPAKREEELPNARTNERVAPPKKPPRASQGSVKNGFSVEVAEKTERGDERGGEEQEEGGKGKRVKSAVPPPKPARRHKSMKTTKIDQEPVAARTKSQTMQHPHSGSRSSQTSPVKRATGRPAAHRKPTPKPRSSLSQSPPPPTLAESIAARLSEEGIDLTVPPYSTMWGGEWSVPALLVSRYAQDLDQPPEQIALLMDDIRIHNLKDKSRELTPMKMTDCMRHSAVSTDSISNFLTSIGLPMYTSVLTRGRGFYNVASLRGLKDKTMEELGIAPNHRGILMEQIRHTK